MQDDMEREGGITLMAICSTLQARRGRPNRVGGGDGRAEDILQPTYSTVFGCRLLNHVPGAQRYCHSRIIFQFMHISAFVCNEKRADVHCWSFEQKKILAVCHAVHDNDTTDNAD